MRYLRAALLTSLPLLLFVQGAAAAEVEIGATVRAAREHFQAESSQIAIDNDDGDWHILVAKQSDHITNLLFEQDRLRYISYNFHLGAYDPQPGSVTHCNEEMEKVVILIAATYGEGARKTTMTWPEREIAITWHGPHHYALAREISDLNGCILVKAMIFDGTEAEFKIFDQRLSKLDPND